MSPQREGVNPETNATRIAALERTVFGNGQPGLEGRLMTAIAEAKVHAKGNYQQGDQNILELLRLETRDRNTQHKENKEFQDKIGKKVDRLTTVASALGGAYFLFQVLAGLGVIHITK